MVSESTPLTRLTTDAIDKLDAWDLRIYLRAAIGVLHMKECELQRTHIARHMAEYNYHSAMLTKHREMLAEAERVNHEGNG